MPPGRIRRGEARASGLLSTRTTPDPASRERDRVGLCPAASGERRIGPAEPRSSTRFASVSPWRTKRIIGCPGAGSRPASHRAPNASRRARSPRPKRPTLHTQIATPAASPSTRSVSGGSRPTSPGSPRSGHRKTPRRAGTRPRGPTRRTNRSARTRAGGGAVRDRPIVPSITRASAPTATTIEWPGPMCPSGRSTSSGASAAEADQPVVEAAAPEDLVHADDQQDRRTRRARRRHPAGRVERRVHQGVGVGVVLTADVLQVDLAVGAQQLLGPAGAGARVRRSSRGTGPRADGSAVGSRHGPRPATRGARRRPRARADQRGVLGDVVRGDADGLAHRRKMARGSRLTSLYHGPDPRRTGVPPEPPSQKIRIVRIAGSRPGNGSVLTLLRSCAQRGPSTIPRRTVPPVRSTARRSWNVAHELGTRMAPQLSQWETSLSGPALRMRTTSVDGIVSRHP